jgi:predicted unusual protein kinase regulating ubiquinone biosynthesis (AarF/ABC1/UbiB family)
VETAALLVCSWLTMLRGKNASIKKVIVVLSNNSRHDSNSPSAFASGVACIVDRVISSGFQLKSTSISSILTQMFSLARQYRVQIDGAYATTAVALAILEGTGKRLNSSIDLFKLALPLVVEKRAKQLLNMA